MFGLFDVQAHSSVSGLYLVQRKLIKHIHDARAVNLLGEHDTVNIEDISMPAADAHFIS